MLRVLIADEQVIADSLAEVLARYAYPTTAAYSGAIAVELADSFRPDVIISDVVMPEMNGFEAGSLIRELLPSCRIILFPGQELVPKLLDTLEPRDRVRDTKQARGTQAAARIFERGQSLASMRRLIKD